MFYTSGILCDKILKSGGWWGKSYAIHWYQPFDYDIA